MRDELLQHLHDIQQAGIAIRAFVAARMKQRACSKPPRRQERRERQKPNIILGDLGVLAVDSQGAAAETVAFVRA